MWPKKVHLRIGGTAVVTSASSKESLWSSRMQPLHEDSGSSTFKARILWLRLELALPSGKIRMTGSLASGAEAGLAGGSHIQGWPCIQMTNPAGSNRPSLVCCRYSMIIPLRHWW